MNFKTQHNQATWVTKPMLSLLVVLGLLITPLTALAAEMTPNEQVANQSIKASELSGELQNSGTRHYFAVEPSERDAEVTLTLTFGPQSEGRIANKVSFWVLTPEAMEQSRLGNVRYGQVALASGNALPNKSDDYKVRATFKAFGRTTYTVIVYSQASVPVSYTLTADKAMLVDASNQSNAPVIAEAAMADGAQSVSAATDSTAAPVQDSKNVAGGLTSKGQQVYFTVVPVDNDEDVTISFDYDPKDNSELNGNINFFVFNADGLRQLNDGTRPEFANLAAGNEVKSGESKRTATFRAVGKGTFTVMVMTRSSVPATFTLNVKGGDFQ